MNIVKKQTILKSFLFVFALCAIINAHAMEENSFDKETMLEKKFPSELENKFTSMVLLERIHDALNQELEKKLPSSPQNFYEAIVLLKSINKLLEQSEIVPEIFNGNFKIGATHCTVLFEHNLPHEVLHPIFNYWFQKVCDKILLEHPKSIEAMNVILEAMSNNVNHRSICKYQKAIESLPAKISQIIQNKFVDTHGWLHKPMLLVNPLLVGEFIREDNHPYVGISIMYAPPGTMYHSRYKFPLNHLLNQHFDAIYTDDGDVLEDQFFTVPTFEQALKKRAQENETTQSKFNCIIC